MLWTFYKWDGNTTVGNRLDVGIRKWAGIYHSEMLWVSFAFYTYASSAVRKLFEVLVQNEQTLGRFALRRNAAFRRRQKARS